MIVRLIMSFVMIAVGAFAFYTVVARPSHSFSSEPFDHAIGIPKIVTRIIRAILGLLFIALGMVSIIRTFGLF